MIIAPDKVGIVTGAASGIGQAVALHLAQKGVRIAVVDLHLAGAMETETQIRESGGEALAIQADVTSRPQVDDMVAQTLKQWAKVDILVNNAGVSGEVPFLEMQEAEWDRVLDVNLKGAFLCGQAVAHAMVQAGTGGKIINIASVNAEVAGLGLAHYCASKAGLRMLTKAMALELAPYRINVNAVAPGIIRTPLTVSSLQDPAKQEALLSRVPWARIGEPQDVANAVLFLASAKADYITGTTLFVDGGWLIE